MRAHDDTHVFFEDPWTHWHNKQGKSNKKAPLALGETELAHRHTNFSKLIDFVFPKRIAVKSFSALFYNCSSSGVQVTMTPRGWIKCLKYLNRLHGPAGAISVWLYPFKKSRDNFCSGTPPSETRTDNPYLCRN